MVAAIPDFGNGTPHQSTTWKPFANVLQASTAGSASPGLRSRLAEARANAKKLLTTEQYDEAVFKAFHIAGWNWTPFEPYAD
jgi:hypothetical protein